MLAVEVVAIVVSILLLLSRFLHVARPVWSHVPKLVAILLPAAVAIVPHAVWLYFQTDPVNDLLYYVVFGLALTSLSVLPEFDDDEKSGE